MRRLWALTLAPLLALGFLTLGGTAANAFGAEVLGCGVDGAGWTTPQCDGHEPVDSGPFPITYAVHNLSGTYSYSWKVPDGYGTPIYSCGGQPGVCIQSGCSATSSTCVLNVPHGFLTGRTYIATLTLTQSGLSRTISATADLIPTRST